jgi:delta24(24(1))-sterol reductase
MSTAAEQNAASTAALRSRTAQLKAQRKDNDGAAAAGADSTDARPIRHGYFNVDMRDEQIVGGGKERALIHYAPGINISEKGKETDKKLDLHDE